MTWRLLSGLLVPARIRKAVRKLTEFDQFSAAGGSFIGNVLKP
jgi:hypothetical protein